MAWEWVAPVVTGAVGIVGMASTWSLSLRDRKVRALERQEQRRAETYVDLLVQVNHEWIPVLSTVAVVVGDRPEPRSPDEEMLLRARVDAYGSASVRDLYEKLRRAVHLLVYTHGIIRERHSRRGQPRSNEIYHEPPDVRDLSDEDLASLKRRRWEATDQLRKSLVEQVRRELSDKR
ncbi:hypothetical protein [Micromonospora fulviviridis]|uniref:hypothetical protein n=1 Tax=Micromonospora fulviviridis TaxID=47860 RepID=UPI0037A214C3